jgi:hypothetical protein
MKLTAYTFETFWYFYHEKNPQYKRNTTQAKTLFESINCTGTKKEIIQGIEKSELSGLDYIKKQLTK